MIHASAADLLSAYVRGGAFGCSDTYLASFFLLRLGSFCIDIAYIYIYIYIYQCAASKLCHLIGWKKILYLTSDIHGFKK
jgi:hypothetical protein